MRAPLLELRDVPTAGDNLGRLAATLSVLVPAGRVATLAVQHDTGCPCLKGRPMTRCTCEVVDVRVELVDPRAN